MYYRKLLDNLIQWKASSNRKPLILRGARQVGKTTLIDMFSKSFDHYIYLNLELKSDLSIFENDNEIDKIVKIIFLKYNIDYQSQKSILIFIDEIQNSANVIKLLRYFYEKYNYLHIIAAGSLLENILDSNFSFPVGRVEYLVLRPFSFEEFLIAKEEKEAHKHYCKIPFEEFANEKLLELFNEFCLIGGMPEVVKEYLRTKNLVTVSKIYENLITTYIDDVEKYANNSNYVKIIRYLITNSIKLAGERIKFEGFANSNYKSREVSECFRILEKSFILSLVYPVTGTTVPLIENIRKSPKIFFFDTGLVNKFAGVQLALLNTHNIDNVYNGRIIEHIVGQELLSINPSALIKNYFWTKEKNQSNAEVDYVLQINDLILPVEVKSGKTGKLRSLLEFVDLSPHNFAIRVYSGKLSIEKQKTFRNKEFYLLNLPIFLVGKIYEYALLLITKQKLD
jgi:predicted AAA+ superfamily ATPase